MTTREHIVLLRITSAEQVALLAQADQQRITLPELIRRAALERLRPPSVPWHGNN